MRPNSDTIMFHGLELSVEDLYSHVLVTGRPGSGKSRGAIVPLLRQLLALNARDETRKVGMFCLDGKGGELRGYIQEALRACRREGDLVIIGPNPGDATFNPIDPTWDDVKVANELIAAADFLGENAAHLRKASEPFWDRAMRDTLTSLVAIARHMLAKGDDAQGTLRLGALTLEHLVRLRPLLTKPDAEIVRIAADLAAVLEGEAGASLVEYAALPTATRQSVASSVGPVLSPFGRRPLRDVLVPRPGRLEADLGKIVSEGKVVLLDVGDAENAVELLPAAALVKSCFARMILSRRRKATNQERPVFAILEEFQKVLTPVPSSPSCEANWMDTCRWCGCGVILCTQGLSSLLTVAPQALVDKIFMLCGTQMWLGSSDPLSGAYAAHGFGTRTRYQVHRTMASFPPPPLLFPADADGESDQTERRVLVPVATPLLSPEKLAATPPGTIHIRLRDGSTHTVKADLATL
jgi:hypothetical protein